MAEPLTMSEWAEVCEAVTELDEPPIRRCPNCACLAYEAPRGVIACSNGCLLRLAGESGPWVVCRPARTPTEA